MSDSNFTKIIFLLKKKKTSFAIEWEQTWKMWVCTLQCDYEIYGYSNSLSGIWHMLLEARVGQLIT